MTGWAARVDVQGSSELNEQVQSDLESRDVAAAIVTGGTLSIVVYEPLDIAGVQKYIDEKGWSAEWVEHRDE